MSSTTVAGAYSATGVAWQRGPGRVYDRLAEVLVGSTPVSLAERTVLDLGAGTGAASRAISAAGGSPIAADVAIGMLQAIGPTRIPSAVADVRALPFADQCLGGVMAAFSLNHVAEPEVALREAARVVVPGSPVLVSAYAADDAHPVKDAVAEAATELGWQPAPWVDELRTVSMPVLASIDGARAAAERAGLIDAAVQHVEVGFPELHADDLVAWRLGMAQLAPFVATLSAAGRDRLRIRARELLGVAPPLVRRVVLLSAVV